MAIIAVHCLHVVLPARYRVQPVWVIPVVLLMLLAVLIAGTPARIDRQKVWPRVLMGIVIAVITLANLLAAKPWAKALMMLEAAASLALAALVISRAINIL